MLRGERVGTMPRLITASASSLGVQWLTGRLEAWGTSQATATIWQNCSEVNVAGRPRRGSSRNTGWRRRRKVSSSAYASAAASCGAAWAQRLRQSRTVGSLTCRASARCRVLAPSALCQMIVARWTSSCGRRRLWTMSSKMARCRSVSGIARGRGPRGGRICIPPAARDD
jgi:hypothetical protein